MQKVKITERGWAGHYILSRECLFRRNTLIEYKNRKWVISTVGNCYIRDKLTQIGVNRYYETMAFVAKDDEYNDADVGRPIDFESPCGLYAFSNDDFLQKYPYADKSANRMHEAVVEELIKKITEETEVK